MKIAVSANGKDLNSQIDPRFGRCSYFVIVETDDLSFEVLITKVSPQVGGQGFRPPSL